MGPFTRILAALDAGDPSAVDQLLMVVYDELRTIAAHKLALEKPGQTLQATALVHEAYLRVLGPDNGQNHWQSRRHFFAAAAEAMRRILIDQARKKNSDKRGGALKRVPLDEVDIPVVTAQPAEDLLALDEALQQLEAADPIKAQLVKLRYFTGASLEETAQMLDISPATAKRYWVYARSWLYGKLHGE
jgi:RNA polymerase sigma factor (TIGR02999 family)